MKSYFGYVRVSTVRQGERGSSLIEQKSAIESYAARNGLIIAGWYEEMETAAKQGRRVFNAMLAELAKGVACGVIIHKIDRSARNLKDWAHLGELIDAGVEVHFAHEALDLLSRGGRLSADIQAVVAADYIRNLRDEVKKGFYGRLKQGFYPLPAPLGYLDRGKARAKEIDPIAGPLVREAFEIYARGEHSLEQLVAVMSAKGLRGQRGGPIARATLAAMFHNPFYIGLIAIKRTGETFQGAHTPIIDKRLFDRVRQVAAGRAGGWTSPRTFAYRRLIRCGECGLCLVGELQKGRVYYRCHSKTCTRPSLRGDRVDARFAEVLAKIAFCEADLRDLRDFVGEVHAGLGLRRAQGRQRAAGALAACEGRLARVTDAFLDGAIDRDTFEARKRLLLEERQALAARVSAPDGPDPAQTLLADLELVTVAQRRFGSADEGEKRDIVKSVTSNVVATSGDLEFRLRFPFNRLLERPALQYGGPYCAQPRTLQTWLEDLLEDSPYEVPQVPEVPRGGSGGPGSGGPSQARRPSRVRAGRRGAAGVRPAPRIKRAAPKGGSERSGLGAEV